MAVIDSGTASADNQAWQSVSASRVQPKGWLKRYLRFVTWTDLFIVLWACAGAHFLAPQLASGESPGQPFTARTLVITILIAALWMVSLAIVGSRDAVVIGVGTDEYKKVLNATFIMFAVVTMATYLLHADLPRSYLLVVMPFGVLGLFVGRWCWRKWLHLRRHAGLDTARVLAVGTRETTADLIRELRRTPEAGYRVVGVCVPGGPGERRSELVGGSMDDGIPGVPVVGSLHDIPRTLRAVGADAVAITPTPMFGPTDVRRLGWQLEGTSAELILAPGLTDVAGPRVHTQPVAGLPLIHVEQPTYSGPTRIFKRGFDVAGSLLLMLLLSPVFLFLALAIKFTDPGPVFFRQERVGVDNTKFRMIKFRSMRTDAEEILAELIAALPAHERGAGNDMLFKMKDDPRVTRIGKVIRRYSLDELPQLINVLKGDMSLVGPRPPLAREVAGYGEDAHRRLLVRPGMTGLWQVSGRSDLTWEESVRLDLYYVENWSVTGDLMILVKTAKAVLASDGAY